MAYEKYTKASDDCYEAAEPSSTGSRTLTFSEKQDAIWVRVGIATNQKGNWNWSYGGTNTFEIDGVTMEIENNRILEIEAKEIECVVGLAKKCWFQIIGLKKK
tara:strand:+ start:12179 stop:12487 length:309 start_codon:yes stop_codon:yes gene_type:complete